MNEMIKRARTTQEKRKAYTPHANVDFSYLKEWRDVRTLLKDKQFKEMLKENNMTEEEFAYTLQPDVELEKQESDKWYDTYEEIMDGFSDEMIDTKTGVGLVALPYTIYLKKRLIQVIDNLKNIKVEEKVLEAFVESHLTEMFGIFGKLTALKLAIYKENHKFRARNEKKQFVEFLKNSFGKKEDLISFYKGYPVAARVATARTHYMIKNYTNILEHVNKDYKEIEEFLGKKNLVLTDISLSTGDSHEQGNSVSILKFDDKKLVYKPKDLRINQAFESFVDWYVEKSSMLEIKIPKGIYKVNYAYNEFIEKIYCKSEREVERFYTRYGYLVAICYLLNINDLHLENIIASGEHPVIIDMETLFQMPAQITGESAYIDMLKRLETESVAASMLLPNQLHMGGKDKINLSALNGKGGELEQELLVPKNVDTVDFHFENIKGRFGGGDNIPQYGEEKDVDISKYNLLIIEAFEQFMKFILEHKTEALEALELFKGKKVRALLKSTERYAAMIRYANHPRYNEDMKYRERLMMNIWAYPYRDKRIINSEVKDLLFNDIPIFFTYTDSRDVIDSFGKEYLDYYEISGYEVSRKKILMLTDKEIKLQKTIMALALGIMNPFLNDRGGRLPIEQEAKVVNYMAQAKDLANKLMLEAYEKEGECAFINLDCNQEEEWELKACELDLYGGLSGIAVVYLELYRATKEEKYLDFYHMLMKSAINQAKQASVSSAFTGRLSPIYPLLLEKKYLKTVYDIDYLKNVMKALDALTEDQMEKYENHDYITGLAGIIRLLKLVMEYLPEAGLKEETLEKYISLAEKRITKEYENKKSKEGMAHGISGMMYGLVSGGKYDANKVKDLLSYEYHAGVNPEKDFKWCWGYPGMIQARIAINKIDRSVVDKRQLNSLIRKFEAILNESVASDSLCHGTGSIVTTLKMIYEYTKDNKWLDYLKKYMADMYMHSLYEGYRVSKVSDIESKGVFDGIYGVAWLYLYAALDINNIAILEMNK
ncbi:MAG: type 2 lantipeptide synthetase LanM [Pseudobutyrivibrio sp.]|nr:type 2 lantipeptide synthetase LanM [Pseudobutyrivibrio sp.]